jgi:hypothetical protein
MRNSKRYKLVRQALELQKKAPSVGRQEHYDVLRRIFEHYGLDPIYPESWLIMAEYYAMLEYGFPHVRPAHRPKQKRNDLELADAALDAWVRLAKRGQPYSHGRRLSLSALAKEMAAKDPRYRNKIGAAGLRKRLSESLRLSPEEAKEYEELGRAVAALKS